MGDMESLYQLERTDMLTIVILLHEHSMHHSLKHFLLLLSSF